MTKKLIEVSLPLDIINDASAYDKMPGIGAHPKGIHHWWARLPLPSARAVLFASLVDDPSSHTDKFPTTELQEKERERLFELIRKLSQKKIHTKQEVFNEAHEEILKHCNGKLPTLLDPFAGGGSIPLEGMRLGLSVEASDLNPVAVLLNKATIELLPQFRDQQPVNPASRNSNKLKKYKLGQGFAEDIRYYGNVINEETKKRIEKYFPKAIIGSKEYNVITWIWARTIKCPNPACRAKMPLVRSFLLSTKKKPNFFSRPIVEKKMGGNNIVGYEVVQGIPEITGTVTRSGAICVCCKEPVKFPYIRDKGKLGEMDEVLIAMVVNTGKGKTYISPTIDHEMIAKSAEPLWGPDTKFPVGNTRDFKTPNYGMFYHRQAFTKRQLLGLSTLKEVIDVVHKKIVSDSNETYANALSFYFHLTTDRLADFNCNLSSWKPSGEQQMHLFTKQAVPMVWDFTEANILEPKAISWLNAIDIAASSIEVILTEISKPQAAIQFNAAEYNFSNPKYIISTDPPYYDNIGYSDLSDFFYVWLRHGLQKQYPELLSTVLVPKMDELVASEYRYGSKEAAKNHFENGFKQTFANFRKGLDSRFPLTVYYAFKQDEDSEKDEEVISIPTTKIGLSTGWETLLEGLVSTGFQITATWPIKASQKWRMIARDSNALTNYILLACRPRSASAKSITRREYLQILKKELPNSIEVLQHSNLAPVDMAQATIGPGMAIFSRYEKIMEQDGKPMTVKTALSLINKTLDEILAEQEGDFDVETRWAISWFEQNIFAEGLFGDADGLARAKNTAVNALVHTGIVKSGGGKVKLISREELKSDWDPSDDNRVVIWELTQHLIKQLQERGELGAAQLYKKLGATADVARELAYRLFTICEKKSWTQEAQAYNSLVLSWNQIVAESYNIKDTKPTQQKLDF